MSTRITLPDDVIDALLAVTKALDGVPLDARWIVLGRAVMRLQRQAEAAKPRRRPGAPKRQAKKRSQ